VEKKTSRKKGRKQIAMLHPIQSEHTKQQSDLSTLHQDKNNLWREVVDAVADWVSLIDIKGKILITNLAGQDFTGKSSSELIGKSCCKLVHGSTEHIAGCPLVKALSSKQRESAILELPDTGKWLMVVVDPVIDEKGKMTSAVHVVTDITERKKTELALWESEKKYRSLFDSMLNGFAYCKIILDEDEQPVDFVYLDVNDAFEELTGLKREDVLGKKVTEAIPGIKNSHPELFDIYGEVTLTGKETKFDVFFEPLKIWLTISVYSLRKGYFVSVFENITKRKQAEEEHEVMIKLLSLINSSNGMHELMRLVLIFLKNWSGCEAVGIRLIDGEDFPYYLASGFSDEFIKAENRLCSVNKIGELVRDDQGRPFLECMCGNVISGRFKPSKPFFTKHGSFWTNSTTELLASTTKTDRLAKTRNRCNTAGYESVALIPLRAGKETFGLLQFNDKKAGCFTPDRIVLFERLADSLAIGLAQRKTEQELRTSESQLSEAMQIAKLGHWEYNVAEGLFTFNDQFYSIYRTSVEQVGGYKVSPARYAELFLYPEDVSGLNNEIRNAIETTDPNFSSYGEHRVIFGNGETGYFSVRYFVIKDSQGHTVKTYGVNQDITERKKAEKALQDNERFLKSIFDAIQDGISVLDTDFTIRRVNGIMNQWYSAKLPLEGKKCFQCYRNNDKPCEPCPTIRCVKTGKTERDIVPGLPGSAVEWMELFSYPIKDPNSDRITGIVEFVRDVTEHKKAENALRKSEENFRSFVQNFHGIAFRGRMDFTPVFCHGSVEEITGYTEEDLVAGKPRWDQIIYPDDLPAVFTDDEKKLRSVPNYSCEREYRIVRKDGQIRWVHEVIQNVCDESGKPAMVQGAIYDITERKRAERELTSKEQFLNRIIDQSPFATWISDAEGTLQRANPALKKMLNLTDEQLVGKYNVLQDPLVEKQGLMGLVRSVYEKGRTVHFNCRWSGEDISKWDLKGSRTVNIEATMFPIHDPDGKLTNVVLHWIDITERKRAEAALLESEIHYRELFENMSSGVAVYDASDNGEDFIFKKMNKAGENSGRVRRTEIIGKKVTEVFPGVEDIGLLDALRRVWRTGKPEYHPVSFYKDQRMSQWVENHIYKLPSGEIVTVYDDVTKRRQAEDNMIVYQNKLKSLASQLALSEEQSRRRIAMELHDHVGQALAFARLELDTARQLAPRELAANLKNASKAILGVIDDLHTLSFDLSSPVLREFGLEAAISDLLDEWLRKTPGLQGQFVDDGKQKPLNEDVRAIVFRSVRELVTNVVKHAQASKLDITAKRIDDEMQVVVKDNGVGFDTTKAADRAARKETFGIFSIEEQLSSLGGECRILSEPGEGTTAILTAPLRKD
jgi:PAS domain S-box-containing protein